MTTQEAHVELDVLLQKIDSNWNKNFLPQEKDIFLNNEILRFVKQRINPRSNRKQQGAYDTVKRTQDLDDLIKTEKIPILYPDNQREAFIELPFDYLGYINAGIEICCNCEEQLTDSIYYLLEFEIDDDFINDNYTITLNHCDGDRTFFNTEDLPNNYIPENNISTQAREIILVNAILSLFKLEFREDENIEIKYNSSTKKFTIKSLQNCNLTITVNPESETPNNIVITPIQEQNKTNNLENYILSRTVLSSDEDKYDINRSYLSNSKANNIVTYHRQGKILITPPDSAIMGKCELIYFRKPVKIDLYLDINSELDDTVMKEIIGNTAETMKGVMADDSYQKYLQQNTLIE